MKPASMPRRSLKALFEVRREARADLRSTLPHVRKLAQKTFAMVSQRIRIESATGARGRA